MDKIEIRGARTHNLKDVNLPSLVISWLLSQVFLVQVSHHLRLIPLYAEGAPLCWVFVCLCSSISIPMEKPDVDHIEVLISRYLDRNRNRRLSQPSLNGRYDYRSLWLPEASFTHESGNLAVQNDNTPLCRTKPSAKWQDKVLELPVDQRWCC